MSPLPGYFAWRGCTLEIKPASSFRAQEGENQNSISVTSHGSKRPIRCCQEAEKCKVTVHFTSDSVSVSLAGSPVNSQRAVKVERCWRQTAAPPLLLLLLVLTTLSSTPLCFVFQLTGQRERRQCAGSQAQADTLFWRPSSLSIPLLSIVLCFPFFPSFPFLFLSPRLMTRASCSTGIIHRFFFNNCL